MDRRTFVKGGAAAVGASTLPQRVFAQAAGAPDKLRFGYAITQSGPLGPGAESTTVSQYKLWQKRVNDAGGINLSKFNRKVPVEFVSYDDQGRPDELIKLTERLVQQDRVDMVLGPYATHMNLASAPIVNKYEYPVIMTTATTTKTYDLGPKWTYAFWNISQPNESTHPLSQAVAGLKREGKLSGKVAVVHVAVEFGVEMHAGLRLNVENMDGCSTDMRASSRELGTGRQRVGPKSSDHFRGLAVMGHYTMKLSVELPHMASSRSRQSDSIRQQSIQDRLEIGGR